MEMIKNVDEVITLRIENKNLIKENKELSKENLELKEKNNYMEKQLKSIEDYSTNVISLIS